MKSFVLGDGLKVDLATLIDTRLLVQANSGGGKSRTIRRLLEQTHGAVQHLVIDLEGEFASLREKFDYVVAAKGGDTPADPRSAALLAERLLELKVSAILDIYELKHADRIRFVRLFLEALVNARKELWHPALVIVDEAHTFCPEQGEAESASAVIDLCTRGRKRGFCAVLATQRLSKLHKDAAAECNNKLIGRTGLDVDMKRAAYELGFTTKEQQIGLRSLAPGEFFAFGPALSREVQRVQVGDVETSHPKAGSSRMAFVAPPPTDKVRALLPQLADLPAEVEKRELTQKELKARAATAEQRARQAERALEQATAKLASYDGQPKTSASKRDSERAGKIAELKQQLAQRERALEEAMKILVKINAVDFSARGGEALEQAVTAAVKQITQGIEQRVEGLAERMRRLQASAFEAQAQVERLLNEKVDLTVTVQKQAPFTVTQGAPRAPIPERVGPKVDAGLPPAKQKILNALAFLEGIGVANAARAQLALLADTTPASSAYSNNLGALRSAGFIDYPGQNRVALTEAGRSAADTGDVPSTSAELHAVLQSKLPPAKWKIVAALIAAYPQALPKAELASRADTTDSSSAYSNNLGSLRSLGLLDYPSQGHVVAQPVLFLEGR